MKSFYEMVRYKKLEGEGNTEWKRIVTMWYTACFQYGQPVKVVDTNPKFYPYIKKKVIFNMPQDHYKPIPMWYI